MQGNIFYLLLEGRRSLIWDNLENGFRQNFPNQYLDLNWWNRARAQYSSGAFVLKIYELLNGQLAVFFITHMRWEKLDGEENSKWV